MTTWLPNPLLKAVAGLLLFFFVVRPVRSQDSLSILPPLQIRSDSLEPMGAEDNGAEDNVPSIPEPMVFDLVRGLGADRGEFEVNVLGLLPTGGRAQASTVAFDPFGPSPSSNDRGQIEWAPEIEYAVADGLAIEFELPFEGSQLESYKFAGQLTFGTAMENRFIHGGQVIVEPQKNFEVCDFTFLYLAGLQINDRWSSLGMIGLRPQITSGGAASPVDGLLNFTLFWDANPYLTLGLESNFVFGQQDRTSLLLMPQVDYELTDHLELQLGIGPGYSEFENETLAGLRLIHSR